MWPFVGPNNSHSSPIRQVRRGSISNRSGGEQ